VFDLRKIRDEQRTDAYGKRMPVSAQSGAFRWALRDARAGAHFLGRSEITSVSKKVSSSYSCNLCCTDSYGSGWSDPGSLNLGIGSAANAAVNERMYDCYGDVYDEPAQPNSWGYDAAVATAATVNGGAEVDGVGDGSMYAVGTWSTVE